MMKTKLRLTDGWENSTSWKRAQNPDSAKNPINDSEWIVRIGDGDRHRVTFALEESTPVVQCDCEGYHYDGRCAHILKIWWDWVRGKAIVTDLDTGRQLTYPTVWVSVGGNQ